MQGTSPVELKVENARLLSSKGLTSSGMGVAVDESTIVSVGSASSLPDAHRTIDAGGNILAPGLVDEHVHDRSIGQRHKEGWETLTRAAAAGGVTTVLGHGNTDPFVDRPAILKRKLTRANRSAIVDFGCFAWLTPDSYDQVESLVEAGAVGLQASLEENALDTGQLQTAMIQVERMNERLGIHVEDGPIIDSQHRRIRPSEMGDPINHCRSRPTIAEVVGAATVVELAANTRCPIHVFQVSSGQTLEPLARGKQMGLDLTIETTPHYLWFDNSEMAKQGSLAIVSPPLRTAEERSLLWTEGIIPGVIDCIGTDHAPHTDAEKYLNRPFESVGDVAPGFVGVETAASVLLTFVDHGRLTLPQWIRLHSTNPAKTWGLYPQKGSLQIGTDADLILVDDTIERTVDRTDISSKSTATVWDGETLTGSVQTTIVRGNVVYDDGTILTDNGYGKAVR